MDQDTIRSHARAIAKLLFAACMRAARFLGRQMWRPVAYTGHSVRNDLAFRRGFVVAVGWMIASALLWQGGVSLVEEVQDRLEEWRDDRDSEGADDASTPAPGTPAYVEKVRNARARIAPFTEDILPGVRTEYNTYVGSSVWRERAMNCLRSMEQFKKAERLTLFPAELLAGIALHESAGCNMGARDRMGGRGWMQLTHISLVRHVAPAARMLGVDRSEMRYQTDVEHNLLTGVMVLDDYERKMGSRPLGLLAYNMGTGGVRRAMVRTGWSAGEERPTIVEMRGVLRNDARAKPRVYVQKVLATAVMMRRVANGDPLTPLKRLSPNDVPGWDPREDGADWRPASD